MAQYFNKRNSVKLLNMLIVITKTINKMFYENETKKKYFLFKI